MRPVLTEASLDVWPDNGRLNVGPNVANVLRNGNWRWCRQSRRRRWLNCVTPMNRQAASNNNHRYQQGFADQNHNYSFSLWDATDSIPPFLTQANRRTCAQRRSDFSDSHHG